MRVKFLLFNDNQKDIPKMDCFGGPLALLAMTTSPRKMRHCEKPKATKKSIFVSLPQLAIFGFAIGIFAPHPCQSASFSLFFSEEELGLIRPSQKGGQAVNNQPVLSALSYQDGSSWFFVLNGEVISSDNQDALEDYEILEITPQHVTLKGRTSEEDAFTLHPHQEYRIVKEAF